MKESKKMLNETKKNPFIAIFTLWYATEIIFNTTLTEIAGIPKSYLKDVNHLLVYHGRALCTARAPKCDKCPLKTHCNYCK